MCNNSDFTLEHHRFIRTNPVEIIGLAHPAWVCWFCGLMIYCQTIECKVHDPMSHYTICCKVGGKEKEGKG